MDEIKVTTKSGFEVVIAPEALDDWEILKMLRRVEEGENTLIIDVTLRLLGAEQQKALEESLRNPETGRVPATEMMKVVNEIFILISDLKK